MLRSLRQRKTWQVLVQYIGGLALVTLVGIAAANLLPADYFDRKSHDWFHKLEWFPAADADHPADRFLIVYIDDVSHTELQQPYDLTWSRDLHAQLLEKITRQHPALVFYDMIFDQPSSDPQADDRMAKAIENAGVVVLSASRQLYFHEDNGEPVEHISVPFPLFRRAAAAWGVAAIKHDYADNGMRRMDQAYFDDRFRPAYWQAAKVIAPQRLGSEDGYKQPRWIRYIGPPPSIEGISFSDALQNDSVDFTGKYVFIGARHSVGMPGVGRDVYRSPYGPPIEDKSKAAKRSREGEFPGVELQAVMVHNILNHTWLKTSGSRMHLVVVGLAALLLTLLVNPFGPTGSLLSSVLLAAGFVVVSIWYIDDRGVFFAWLVPVVVQTPTAFVYSNVCNYYFLARKRKQLKRVFSSYLSPVMVQRIAEAEEEPQLGGKEEEITPFFSDVVGYSKFSELLTPIELTSLMNEYLGAMTEVLQDEGGTLDKFIGDAIVAFFGAPLPMQRHAYRACRTAARMQEVQARLCSHWRESGNWPAVVTGMQTRIGLNSGRAVVGNMGCPARFNYSMTGDTVNLAARCESGAKHFGVFTMVTGSTRDAAILHGPEEFIFRKLNRVSVVGREQPVLLYELMGLAGQVTDRELECRSLYEDALECYFQRDWAGAETRLRQSADRERWQPPGHGVKTNPSLVLLQQVLDLKEHPPADGWDGVLRLDSK